MTAVKPEMGGLWAGPIWGPVAEMRIDCFRPEGSPFRPVTRLKLLYDDHALYGLFRVEDRYVRCVFTEYQAPVYKDSCVEAFFRPRETSGYFNFEFGCGGALRCGYITDPERTGDGFREWMLLPAEDGGLVSVRNSLPKRLDIEIAEAAMWLLEFRIPLRLIEKYAGPVRPIRGSLWTANFFKCADASSHPHWASWQPLPEKNFHRPDCFGELFFS